MRRKDFPFEPNSSEFAADIPFFLISFDANSHATIKHLKDWETCQGDSNKVCLLKSSTYLEKW